MSPPRARILSELPPPPRTPMADMLHQLPATRALRATIAPHTLHAVVTAELLGRPVALRGPDGGPVGFRD